MANATIITNPETGQDYTLLAKVQVKSDGVEVWQAESEGRQVALAIYPTQESAPTQESVQESLPATMRDAFIARDKDALVRALMSLTESERKYHMDRCVACGLWNDE